MSKREDGFLRFFYEFCGRLQSIEDLQPLASEIKGSETGSNLHLRSPFTNALMLTLHGWSSGARLSHKRISGHRTYTSGRKVNIVPREKNQQRLTSRMSRWPADRSKELGGGRSSLVGVGDSRLGTQLPLQRNQF